MAGAAVRRFGAAAFVVATVAGCSSDGAGTGSVAVDVTVDVCAGESCFVAPVPGATVTIEGPDAGGPHVTGED